MYFCEYFEKLNDAFLKLKKCFDVALEATEKDIGRPLTEDERKLCVCYGLLYVLSKKGEDDESKENES